MEGFVKRIICHRGLSYFSPLNPVLILVLITASLMIYPKMSAAEENKIIAILPFRIHSLKPLDHLKFGLQEMLINRMVKRGYQVISPELILKHPLVSLEAYDNKNIIKTGKDLKADWVVMVSLTQIGPKASIDLKLLDVAEHREPFLYFLVADNIDNLDNSIERLAVSIDNCITGITQIESVKVEGNERIEKEAILAVIQSKKGQKLDYDLLDKDLRDVFGMGYFIDVNIETEDGLGGKIITFNVTEKPSIGKIVFKGNKKEDDDDLKEQIGIKLYSILDQNEINESVKRLREYYHNKAYYNVDIEYDIKPLKDNEVSLEYEIIENDKVFITKIEFTGNTQFDDDELKDIMETSEKGFFKWFSWFTKWGYLDRKKLEFDVQKIASFYHNHGFIKAKVGEPKVTFEKETGLTVTIEIEEGQQYGVNKVNIEGDLIKPEEDLQEIVQIGKEKVFSREIVRKDILALRELYVDEGHAYAEVSPSSYADDKTRLVDITYRISKGPKVRFERINISGNTVTRDKVIRRELKVIEGEDFSGKSLRRSSDNLHRLMFFEDVEIQTKKGSAEDLIVLDIKVKERPTGVFSIGAGYSSQDAVFAMGQVTQNNLFGRGQKLELTAKIGAESNEFDLTFIEPWFLDMPLSLGTNLYDWKYEYDDYTRRSTGGSATFRFLLGIDDFTKGSVEYNYDDAKISDINEATTTVALKEMAGRHLTSSITLGIERDSRDRTWNTTKGSVNSIYFQYAGGFLGGDLYFNKYVARSAWYFPVFWDMVFMAQGRLGYIAKRSGGDLFIYQKFMIGGLRTVRGFDYRSISPVDPLTGDKIGGEKEMIFNLECQFPLFKEHGISAVMFFDAGNVFTKDENYSFSGIRRSVGAGIRWYSPMGPLLLDYGMNLDRRDGEPSGKWEFSVGGLF